MSEIRLDIVHSWVGRGKGTIMFKSQFRTQRHWRCLRVCFKHSRYLSGTPMAGLKSCKLPPLPSLCQLEFELFAKNHIKEHK